MCWKCTPLCIWKFVPSADMATRGVKSRGRVAAREGCRKPREVRVRLPRATLARARSIIWGGKLVHDQLKWLCHDDNYFELELILFFFSLALFNFESSLHLRSGFRFVLLIKRYSSMVILGNLFWYLQFQNWSEKNSLKLRSMMYRVFRLNALRRLFLILS